MLLVRGDAVRSPADGFQRMTRSVHDARANRVTLNIHEGNLNFGLFSFVGRRFARERGSTIRENVEAPHISRSRQVAARLSIEIYLFASRRNKYPDRVCFPWTACSVVFAGNSCAGVHLTKRMKMRSMFRSGHRRRCRTSSNVDRLVSDKQQIHKNIYLPASLCCSAEVES